MDKTECSVPVRDFDAGILYENPEKWMDRFRRQTYEESFQKFTDEFADFYSWLESVYSGTDSEAEVSPGEKAAAEALAMAADRKFASAASKIAHERLRVTLNMYTVTYIIPGILRSRNGRAAITADAVCTAWAAHFPESHIKPASFDQINEGFKRKLCYITTAVCEGMHKSDDCEELRKLKNYRDGYLAEQPDGQQVIDMYYDIAPTIVKRISGSKDPDGEYRYLWSEYIEPCIRLIDSGSNEECRELYSVMVRELSSRYLITNTHDVDKEGKA